MRKKILAGNWKMHKLNKELESYFHEFNSLLANKNNKVEIIFGAPYTLLDRLQSMIAKFGYQAAAQNCHFEIQGAFTGEISLNMLSELSVSTVILGHSERRQYYNETDESVAKKVKSALKQNFQVIACIGESEAERKNNLTNSVIEKQLSAIMHATENSERLVIAYEPVWAIGTGIVATTAQAQEAHCYIRELLSQHYGKERAQSIRILYGGSMKPDNIAELIAQPDIDGGLVGGASLKAKDFAEMANIISK